MGNSGTDWLKAIDNSDYKTSNRENWAKNVDYWTTKPLRHVVDNLSAMREAVDRLVNDHSTVVDMGCGSGFLYHLVREKSKTAHYVGMDFNSAFIEKLSSEFSEDPHAEFILQDIDQNFPDRFLGSVDVVFSFFVLLEVADLGSAYRAGQSLLKPGGTFSAFTIEYTFLILAVSRDMIDFKENLRKYQEIRAAGETPYTFQKIDLGDGESDELTYGSVFHSTADYIASARNVGFRLERFLEFIHTDKFHPKVYQYFEFIL